MNAEDKVQSADNFSKHIAKLTVEIVGSILGMKRPTHKKGQYENLETKKAKAEISTISKARDLIRQLYFDEFKSTQDR